MVRTRYKHKFERLGVDLSWPFAAASPSPIPCWLWPGRYWGNDTHCDYLDDAKWRRANPGTKFWVSRKPQWSAKINPYESFRASLFELVCWRCHGFFRPESSLGGDNGTIYQLYFDLGRCAWSFLLVLSVLVSDGCGWTGVRCIRSGTEYL